MDLSDEETNQPSFAFQFHRVTENWRKETDNGNGRDITKKIFPPHTV